MIATIPTSVEGVAVKADDAVETPLSTTDKPMHFTRIRRLTLVDGTELFACTVCGSTSATVAAVRVHLGHVHGGPKAKGRSNGAVLNTEITLGELMSLAEKNAALHDAIERLSDDRNEWRARARKTEGSLATMRKALS